MSSSPSTNDLAATLAANIRFARKHAGLTQHELAVAIGRGDVMTISRWERAEHKPSDHNLISLGQVLGRDIGWFYTDHARAAA